jgi:NAD(P)H-flavin reductase
MAPLRSIIHTIRDDDKIVGNLTVVYGATTPENLLFKGELAGWNKFAQLYLTVDKSDHHWTGKIGRVDKVLETLKVKKDAVVIVCGPPVMYPGVAEVLLKLGLAEENIQFMLERRMKCGIGKCQHCTCGGKYVCTDGPTFTWKELKNNWESFR